MLKSTLTLILVSFCILSSAQKATISLNISNTSAKTFTFGQGTKFLKRNFLGLGYKEIGLEANKTLSFDFKEPQFISISCYDKILKKALNYSLYISPGDELLLTADFAQQDMAIKVSGEGSNNNQPILNKSFYFKEDKFYGDTLPNQVIAEITRLNAERLTAFDQYIQQFHPSNQFVKDWALKMKYTAAEDFLEFKSNNKFKIKEAYDRNSVAWAQAQETLFTLNDLNNDSAINIREYLSLVATFLLREKERLWQESVKNPDSFIKEWYNTNVTDGMKMFKDDYENLLNEKIINKYFSGKTAAYLYVILLENAIQGSLTTNLMLIFDRFKEKYPSNEYIPFFTPYIDKIVKKKNLKLTNNIVFASNNGKDLKTFEEVLALTKGKNILLDMWGTWCTPCREDMEKDGKAIKDYFKDKGLDYLYIANFDEENEKKWKELIPYFELKGLHILANKELTNDVMAKTKGQGYPTYVFIKKDGSFQLLVSGERSFMIEQLEKHLN